MTNLNCSAVTCVYNKDSLCSRGNIEVRGKDAHISDDTCCGSFEERHAAGDGSAIDYASEHEGCERIQIDCKAENCTYNDSCRCTASAIDISGEDADACQQTCCDTFYCGQRHC